MPTSSKTILIAVGVTLVVILAAVGAVSLFDGDEDSGTAPAPTEGELFRAEPGAPDDVVDAVRDVYPQTSIEDIDITYEDLRVEAPNASDGDVVRWMVEAIEWNAWVDDWNECLDRDPYGETCGADRSPDDFVSSDNPMGW